MQSHIVKLLCENYTVLPLLDEASNSEALVRAVLKDSTQTFRTDELALSRRSDYRSPKLVGGAFGALAHAESFHHPTVRKWRAVAHEVIAPILRTMHSKDKHNNYQVAQLFDRMMVRPVGVKPTAEQWHRDYTPGCSGDEVVYGGWLNLNAKEDQFASLVPGSACSQQKDREGGFHRIDKCRYAQLNREQETVRIPPGHALLMNETCIHQVLSSPQKRVPQMRLFLAFLCSPSRMHPLVQKNLRIAHEQSVPPLKSNQPIPYFPRTYNIYSKQRVLRNRLFELLTEEARAAADQANEWPRRKWPYVLPKLTSAGMRAFSPYTEEDLEVLSLK